MLAETENERYYIIVTMMFGIVFYGYMLGTLQKQILSSNSKDMRSEFEESMDFWIIQLGQCRKDFTIQPFLFEGVRSYFTADFKWNPMPIVATDFFQATKPRL